MKPEKIRVGARVEVMWRDHYESEEAGDETVFYRTLGFVAKVTEERVTLAWHDGTIKGYENFMNIEWPLIEAINVLRSGRKIPAPPVVFP